MAQDFFNTGSVAVEGSGIDVGLRRHMQSVFNYMGVGLAITGLLAMLAATPAFAQAIYGTPLRYVVMFAPLAFILFLNFRIASMSLGAIKTTFYAFCVTMGLSMGFLFLVFTHDSIYRAFFETAVMFGATSLWGYTSKRSLAGMGSFMMMGLFGIIIAGLVNIFLQSSMLQWVSSVACVVIFTGLTAYNVQAIKRNYSMSFGQEANDKMAVMGALNLYLDFINMFRAILYLTGTMRRN